MYCSLVRSVLEYAFHVWAGLPDYLSDLIKSAQRDTLRIILPSLSYDQAPVRSGLQTLLSAEVKLASALFRHYRYHRLLELLVCFPSYQALALETVSDRVQLGSASTTTDFCALII